MQFPKNLIDQSYPSEQGGYPHEKVNKIANY